MARKKKVVKTKGAKQVSRPRVSPDEIDRIIISNEMKNARALLEEELHMLTMAPSLREIVKRKIIENRARRSYHQQFDTAPRDINTVYKYTLKRDVFSELPPLQSHRIYLNAGIPVPDLIDEYTDSKGRPVFVVERVEPLTDCFRFHEFKRQILDLIDLAESKGILLTYQPESFGIKRDGSLCYLSSFVIHFCPGAAKKWQSFTKR